MFSGDGSRAYGSGPAARAGCRLLRVQTIMITIMMMIMIIIMIIMIIVQMMMIMIIQLNMIMIVITNNTSN